MPYPIVHVLFFTFCFSAVAVYAVVKSIFHREISLRNSTQILLLLFVGSLSTLLPDVVVVYSLLANGTFEHCWIGPIPTHSLLFSSIAILFGTLIGYVVYRKLGRAIYVGLFAEAAFLSHLLLDDPGIGGCEYLYPVYKGKFSLYSLLDVSFQNTGLLQYFIISFVSAFSICLLIMMALLALNQLGFEFKYRSEK